MSEILQPSAQGSGVRINQNVSAAATNSANQRNDDLREARRAASADRVADAQREQDQRAEQFRETSEIIQRAIGANTRLEITAGLETNRFIYRAIDVDTGEVVSEWPPEQFARFINDLGEQSTSTQQLAGLVLDEQA